MKEKTLNELYFSWLYDRINKQPRTYVKLCRLLHQIRFRWFVPNDDNRCEDGLSLRDDFIRENNLDEGHLSVSYLLKADCTVFELLVALAERMDFHMYDLRDQENHESRWFLELITNLQLAEFVDNYNDSERFPEMIEQHIQRVIDTFMDRTYDFYGHGGLFPLKRRPRRDQAKVEIWDQLMLYLDENYGH